jgi:hypothetical protein
MSFYLLWSKKQAKIGKLQYYLMSGYYLKHLERSTISENFTKMQRSNALACIKTPSKTEVYRTEFESYIVKMETNENVLFDFKEMFTRYYKTFKLTSLVKYLFELIGIFSPFRNFRKFSITLSNDYKNIRKQYLVDYNYWVWIKYQCIPNSYIENYKHFFNRLKSYMFYQLETNSKYMVDIILNKLDFLKTTNAILSILNLKPIIIEKIKIYTICSITLLGFLFLYKLLKRKFEQKPSDTNLQERVKDLELQNQMLINYNIQLINNFNNKFI